MVKKEKGIIVFGKGWYCKSKIRYICEKYTDIYYIDNAKVGKKSERVFEPKDINCLPYYDIVIMSNQHMWNMVSQILELGVDESRIILGMNMEPAVDHLEECMNKRNIKLLVQDGEIVLECRDSRRKIENYCELKKVIFEYSGIVEAILDKLPTAEIIDDYKNGTVLIKAECYGDGINMWLNSQGDKVKIIEEVKL